MKKIILVLIVFLLTGCYDYVELDELKIVSSLIIDYQEEEYVVNLEVLNTSENAKNGTYFVEGRGKTLMGALDDTKKSADFEPYYSHMNAVILSENMASSKLESMYDGFLRNIEIRKDFYLFVTDDIEGFLTFECEPGKSLGEMAKNSAVKMMENNGKYRTCQFREIVNNYLRDKDFLIGSIKVDDENVILGDSYVFKDNKLASEVPEEVALFANIINQKNNYFEVEGNNSFELHEYKLESDVKKDKIVMNFTAKARVIDVQNGSAITTSDLQELENALKEKLKKKFLETIEYSKKIDVDIFGFNYEYYLHYPKLVKTDTWKNLDYEVNVDVSISEKGMIMNSVGGLKYGK